jgi:peptide/nickel transport system ATP-binding protein
MWPFKQRAKVDPYAPKDDDDYYGPGVTRSASRPSYTATEGNSNSFSTIYGERRHMTGIPGSPPDLRNIPPGCSFHPRCPMAFAPCRSVLPLLRRAVPADLQSRDQQVACHLYDPRYAPPQPPTAEDFAARYEAAYALGQGERSAQ